MGGGFDRCWHKRLNALIFPEWPRDQQHQLHLELVRITSHVMSLQLLDQNQQLNERLTQDKARRSPPCTSALGQISTAAAVWLPDTHFSFFGNRAPSFLQRPHFSMEGMRLWQGGPALRALPFSLAGARLQDRHTAQFSQ